MPRIKQPHTPPVPKDNSLEGCSVTFVNSQTSGITSNHTDLVQKDFDQLKTDIGDWGGAYAGTVATSTHLVATQQQFEKNGKSSMAHASTSFFFTSSSDF